MQKQNAECRIEVRFCCDMEGKKCISFFGLIMIVALAVSKKSVHSFVKKM